MQSAPLHPNEDQRLQSLLRLEVLDTEDERAFDELTELASTICGTSISLISLVDSDRQWFKSRVGLGAKETPRSLAFCAHAILQDEVFEVPDALQDSRFVDNPLVTQEPDIRFYAGAPLKAEDGMPLGTLCVIDQQPKQLSAEQRRALEVLSRQVISQLTLRLHTRKLERINRERDRFFAMISHDLRSPFNNILGFTKIMSQRADSLKPAQIVEFSKDILSGAMRVYQLLDELLQWSKQRLGGVACDLQRHNAVDLIDSTLPLVEDAAKLKSIEIKRDTDTDVYVTADATLAKTVIRNLLSNAIKYSDKGSCITLQAVNVGDVVELSVADTGAGISEELASRLFDGCVESIAGTEGESGSGLGLSLCQGFAQMQQGAMRYDASYTEGSRFIFSLPAA
ncbi:GAF domain-containing sensor histidine kinase [Maricurvus nonylphenolicus]|uniref:GAF domain-containing sensor histidine kinase n=1 Tax=Maricurvus nonylphenolicus TaxID=1008307 RepID=UPI0036F3EE57